MEDRIICAERDDTHASVRQHTEIWHIPHEFTPRKPLCGAYLAGRFKRSKGGANCTTCIALTSPHISHDYYPVLRTLLLGQTLSSHVNEELYERGLVGDKRGRVVLTTRGKLVAADITAPVGWFDRSTGLYHARRALQHNTLCRMECSWHSRRGGWNNMFQPFRLMMIDSAKHRDKIVTCIRCVSYTEPRADVDR